LVNGNHIYAAARGKTDCAARIPFELATICAEALRRGVNDSVDWGRRAHGLVSATDLLSKLFYDLCQAELLNAGRLLGFSRTYINPVEDVASHTVSPKSGTKIKHGWLNLSKSGLRNDPKSRPSFMMAAPFP
jgi:hypothetical protein